MKNFLLTFTLAAVLLSGASCLKGSTTNCTPKVPSSEASEIQVYAAANAMTVTALSSGLYYEVIDPGSGPLPNINSSIVVTYTAKLLDGTIFDQRTTPNNTYTTADESPWLLSELIEGWQEGIQLIRKGGRIQLLVPSSMGYGCSTYRSVPGNSILFFDITLVDVL